MIAFRDEMVKKVGMALIVYSKPEGIEQGISPFTHGSEVQTDVMKTQGLKHA